MANEMTLNPKDCFVEALEEATRGRIAIEELAQFSGAKDRLKALTESEHPFVSEAGAVAKMLGPAVQSVMNSAVRQ